MPMTKGVIVPDIVITRSDSRARSWSPSIKVRNPNSSFLDTDTNPPPFVHFTAVFRLLLLCLWCAWRSNVAQSCWHEPPESPLLLHCTALHCVLGFRWLGLCWYLLYLYLYLYLCLCLSLPVPDSCTGNSLETRRRAARVSLKQHRRAASCSPAPSRFRGSVH